MAVVRAARSGVRFRGEDGHEREVLQIGSGAWPIVTDVRLIETRAIAGTQGPWPHTEEEIYVNPDGLRLWARKCAS